MPFGASASEYVAVFPGGALGVGVAPLGCTFGDAARAGFCAPAWTGGVMFVLPPEL